LWAARLFNRTVVVFQLHLKMNVVTDYVPLIDATSDSLDPSALKINSNGHGSL